MCHNDDEDEKRCQGFCVDNNRYLVKVYIGAVMPKEFEGSFLAEFELCQEEKCVEAAEFALYGGTLRPGEQLPSVISKKYYSIRKAGVTDVLVVQGWSSEKPLTTRMTSKTRQFFANWNGTQDANKFPQAVVFVGTYPEVLQCSESDGCKMTLNPDEDRSHYGDLLDGYPR